ncbi:MAG: hypothetical protein L0H75_11465, partial [Nitrosospira sp.]|nr:hypothetical protein [Nitrosospira sp.]
MATVNYSVPDDVKEAFNRSFADHNKSAIIADLMRKAVANAELAARRKKGLRKLTQGRKQRPTLSDK